MVAKLAYYRVSNRQLATRDVVPEVEFGRFYEDGGVDAMAVMRWYQQDNGLPTPRLEAFPDGWRFLTEVPQLLLMLSRYADREPLQPDGFCNLLTMMDFVDWTGKKHFRNI
jgi:hypothetical protein